MQHCYYNVICEQKCPKSKISILEDLTPIFTMTFRSYFCFLFYSTSPNPLCFDCFVVGLQWIYQRVFAYSVIYAFSSCVLLLQCEHIICSRQNVYVQLKWMQTQISTSNLTTAKMSVCNTHSKICLMVTTCNEHAFQL